MALDSLYARIHGHQWKKPLDRIGSRIGKQNARGENRCALTSDTTALCVHVLLLCLLIRSVFLCNLCVYFSVYVVVMCVY